MTVGVGGSTPEAELAAITSVRHEVEPITLEERLGRIAKAQARMAEMDIAAIWLDGTTDLEYFTGVRHGQTERMIGAIIPAKGEPVYVSPAFEVEKLKTMITIGDRISAWQEHESPYALMVDTLRDLQIHKGTLALDDQARWFVVDGIRRAAEAAGSDYALTPSTSVASWCRQRKSEHEIALISHAMRTTLAIHERAARTLSAGMMTTDVQMFLDQAHRKAGFDTGCRFAIALFGEASAYPHGVPHAQELKDGDVVLIDCGAPMHGYVSDITRSYVFGTPNDRQRQIWQIDHEAQAAGFAAARLGAPSSGIDLATRSVIERHGFGPGYDVPGLPHRTGHGVGMDGHEAPYFVKGDETPLDVGMTGSIEPTLCIYDEFGIRLEDHFFMTDKGAAWHTEPAHTVDDPFDLDR
ncbi:MAG: Xaa-Pro peptidase family protein [Pseudomonadota bacterium]